MPNEKQDLMNHRQTALACKNYTDKEIKASEERILSIVARNNVDFIDHINEPTYRFTAPLNSKLLMLQSVAGNSVKYSPSVASDNNATHIKALPSTVYDLDVAKVEGVGYKVNQLVKDTFHNYSYSLGQWGSNNLTDVNIIENHNYLLVYKVSSFTSGNLKICFGNLSSQPNAFTKTIDENTTLNTAISSVFTANSTIAGYKATLYNLYATSAVGTIDFVNLFDLTADFGSGNEPASVSDCATAYLQRGINIYEYTPQQSSIKNNAFTGVKVEGTNKYDYGTSANYTMNGGSYPTSFDFNNHVKVKIGNGAGTYCINNTKFKGGTYSFSYTYTSVASATPRVLFRFYDISGNLLSNLSISGLTWNNYYQAYYSGNTSILLNLPSNVAYFNVGFGGADVVGEYITYENVMLNYGSTAMSYVPYTSQTIPIDLTTIKDSNNVSLFPSGKMMGNSNVADFITPYNQESRYNQVDLSQCNWRVGNYGSNTGWYTDSITDIKTVAYSEKFNGTCEKYEIAGSKGVNLVVGVIMVAYGTSRVWVGRADGDTTNIPTGILQYERATYLTSNTDLTSLTKINAQSNGTITLNNTDNVDMPNLISYNGVIKHALATAVKYESFNVWDEEWEVGKYGSDGQKIAGSSNTIRSKNLIPVLPNTTYYIKCSQMGYLYGYDINGDFISNFTDKQNATFTTPANCYFLAFWVASPYGTTYLNDICINISGTLNGTYKPHKPTYTRALTNNEAKYSWGITTGVRNVRTYCDDEGNAVGEGSLSVKSLDMGGLNYTRSTSYTNPFFYASFTDIKTNGNAICSKYNKISNLTATTFGANASNLDFCIGLQTNQTFIRDDFYTDVIIFKTAILGTYLFYEKDQVTTETLDDFDYFFDCEEGDTFTIIGCELLQCYATYSFLIKEAKSNE